MTKTAVLFLSAGFVALVIVIAILVRTGCPPPPPPPPPPPKSRVEIIAPKGTQVFARLPHESEQHLGEAPLSVDVRVDATIILRCEDKEKTYLPDSWRNGRINEPSFCPDPPPPPTTRVASVSINAVPWAEVFIKVPQANSYMTPQRIHFTIPPDSSEEKPNVTPIRGGLRVPIGTDVKLEYGDREKIFSYEAWKTSKVISHDFLSP